MSNSSSRGAAQQPYCPFEPTRDAAMLGLERHTLRDDRFGQVNVMVRRSASADARDATVLLHGIGGTWSSWSYVIREAERSQTDLGNLLIFDLPGFGDSQNTSRSLDAEQVASLVVHLAAQLGFRRGRVVGQSMGGYLALMLAALQPAFCSGAVALSGTLLGLSETMNSPRGRLIPRPNSLVGRVAYRSLRVAGIGIIRPLARCAARTGALRVTMRNTVAHPDLLSTRVLTSIANGLRPEAFLLAADNARLRDAMQDWRGITCPVVLAFGAEDRLAGEREAAAVREVLPDIRLVIIEDCGHLIPVEKPRSVVDLIRGLQTAD